MKLLNGSTAWTLAVWACLAFSTANPALAQAHVPFVDEISPISATPGGSAFTLTVRGVEFVPGAVIRWTTGNTTTPLATTYETATRLTATVPASLITAAGIFTVTVGNPAAGVPPSNPVFFNVSPVFSSLPLTTTDILMGDPWSFLVRPIATGDFNGDGKLDLAVGNPGGNTVSIQLSNGDGTFSPGATLTVGLNPGSIAVGDFNGDGKPDLAVAAYSDSTVTIFLGNGDGTFTQSSTISLVCCNLFVATADFNRDGKLDLVVSQVDNDQGEVVMLRGNGDGTFTKAFSQHIGSELTAISVGDFNNDGILDLAVTDILSSRIFILLGNATGFTLKQAIFTAINPGPATVGDFNGDGILDIAIANEHENRFTIYTGNSDGTFSYKAKFDTELYPYGITPGNFDGDDNLDLAVTNSNSNTVTVWHGLGNGTFVKGTTAPTGSGPGFVALGDFNGDGLMDFVVGNGYDSTITVVLQQP